MNIKEFYNILDDNNIYFGEDVYIDEHNDNKVILTLSVVLEKNPEEEEVV